MNFDIEKAKSGDVIEYEEAYGWTPVRFIGVWTVYKGNEMQVVCDVPWNDKPEIVPVSKLRMAKKKEVMRYRVALMNHEVFGKYIHAASDEAEEYDFQDSENFIKWITDWQEYEIGANDVPR